MYEYKKKDFLLDEKVLFEAGEAVMKALYKYVKIEMRIPQNILMQHKKHNTNENIKKRVVKSSKAIRQSSTLKSNNKSNQLKDIVNQMQMNFRSEKIVL